MTTREAQLVEQLDMAWKLLQECEKQRTKLEQKVADLMADLTAISRMEGRE